MTGNKNHSKLLISILLFFLSSSGLLLGQRITQADVIFNSDYEIFLDRPEIKLSPRMQVPFSDQPSSTISLQYSRIDLLRVDSSFVIDTIYSHMYGNYKNFKDYRRIFSYDKFYRIKSVIAETYKDSNWVIHQISDIAYNSINKVEKINHRRYQKPYDDSLIIINKYDDGKIISETREEIDTLTGSWFNVWEKKYDYEDGMLSDYYIEGSKDFYENEEYRKEFKYNRNNLPIQRISYKLFNGSLVYEFMNNWIYNEQGLLRESHFFKWKNSQWQEDSKDYYIYDINGNLIEKLGIDFYDKDTSRYKRTYYYNNETLDSICYSSFQIKNGLDSLVGYGTTTYEYDSIGGYTIFSKYKNSPSGRRVIIKRDKFENIIFIQDEIWNNDKWHPVNSTRIVYKRKEY